MILFEDASVNKFDSVEVALCDGKVLEGNVFYKVKNCKWYMVISH